MLISACSPNWMARPAAARIAKAGFLVEQLDQHPRDDGQVEAGDGEAGDQPELLADDREDVVGVRLGQAELARSAARTHAEQPARGQRAHRILDLEIVALAEQEAVDAGRRHVIEEISEDDADHRRRAEADRAIRMLMPASASIAIHTQPKMMVEPKSGWRISRTATAPVTAADSAEHRQRLVLLPQAQQPGHGDDEEGLQEFGRLQLADADVDPARRAVHLRRRGTARRPEARRRRPRRRATAASARSRGIIEMPIITGSRRAIHTIWR